MSSPSWIISLGDIIDFIRINDLQQLNILTCNMQHFAVILPLHSVDCDRGFYVMNATISKLGNRMYIRNVNNYSSDPIGKSVISLLHLKYRLQWKTKRFRTIKFFWMIHIFCCLYLIFLKNWLNDDLNTELSLVKKFYFFLMN